MNRQDRRTTRRQFVQKTLVLAPAPLILRAKSAAASPGAPPRAASDMVYYQGSVPNARLAALDDTRLLATVDGPAGVISTDAARTWSVPFPLPAVGEAAPGDSSFDSQAEGWPAGYDLRAEGDGEEGQLCDSDPDLDVLSFRG